MPYYTNSRAAERDVLTIRSRGKRREVRKAWKAKSDAQRDFERDKRARERLFATYLRTKDGPPKDSVVVKLRSWKQASKVASFVGGDLWIRARVALKQFRQRRARTPSGQLAMNHDRMTKVANGDLVRIGDDRDSSKVRYLRPGLVKKLVRAGEAAKGKKDK